MTDSMDKKEVGFKKLIEAVRSTTDKAIIMEVAALSYALGLEAGVDLKTEKGPAA